MKRILVVDDHEAARKALRCYLEVHGFHCDEAEDGIDALAWLDQGEVPDMIITDNQMPNMGGVQLVTRLKEHPDTLQLPIILYSGNLSADVKAQALQAGAWAVLDKPYNFSDLVGLVNQALRQD